MKRFFKQDKNSPHGHLLEVASMSALLCLLVLGAVFISSGGMEKVNTFLAANNIVPSSQKAGVVTITVSPWNATPSPATPGTDVTLHWTATNADQCQFLGGWFGDNTGPAGSNTTATYPGAVYTGVGQGYVTIVAGDHGVIDGGVINSNTNYKIRCTNSGPSNTGDSGWVGMTAIVGASSCGNGLNYATYGPSCTCPANQHQSGSSCVANAVDNCPNTPTASGAGLRIPLGAQWHITTNGYNFCVNNQDPNGNTYFISTLSASDVASFYNATQGYLSGKVSSFTRTPGF